MLSTIENIEALSTKNLAIVVKSSDKSLIYIRKNNCPKFKPLGTPATTSAHEECWPFTTTLSFLSFKKSPKYLGACLLCHFALIYNEDLHATLYVKSFGCIKKYSSDFKAISE